MSRTAGNGRVEGLGAEHKGRVATGTEIRGERRITPGRTTRTVSQRVVQVCLCLVAAIAMTGGTLQMFLGQPDTSPRLDNVHRFMAGVYFSTGVISLWAAWTIRDQGTLVYLLALGVLLAGVGRLVSISRVGLPEPHAVWLGYLIPELLLPVVIVIAHYASTHGAAAVAAVAAPALPTST
jgi:hypothetical protein